MRVNRPAAYRSRRPKGPEDLQTPPPDPGAVAIRDKGDQDIPTLQGVLVMRSQGHYLVWDGQRLLDRTAASWNRTFLEDLPELDPGHWRVIPVLTFVSGTAAGTQGTMTVSAGVRNQAFAALREWEHHRRESGAVV